MALRSILKSNMVQTSCSAPNSLTTKESTHLPSDQDQREDPRISIDLSNLPLSNLEGNIFGRKDSTVPPTQTLPNRKKKQLRKHRKTSKASAEQKTAKKSKRTGFYSLVGEEEDQLSLTTSDGLEEQGNIDQQEVKVKKGFKKFNQAQFNSNDALIRELKNFQQGLKVESDKGQSVVEIPTAPKLTGSTKFKKVTFQEARENEPRWSSLEEELKYVILNRKCRNIPSKGVQEGAASKLTPCEDTVLSIIPENPTEKSNDKENSREDKVIDLEQVESKESKESRRSCSINQVSSKSESLMPNSIPLLSRDKFFGVRSQGDGGNPENNKENIAVIVDPPEKVKTMPLPSRMLNMSVFDHIPCPPNWEDDESVEEEETETSNSEEESDGQIDVRASFRYIKQTPQDSIKNSKDWYNELISKTSKNDNHSTPERKERNYEFGSTHRKRTDDRPVSHFERPQKSMPKKNTHRVRSHSTPRAIDSYGWSSSFSGSSSSSVAETPSEDENFTSPQVSQGTIKCLKDLSKFKQLQIVTLRNNGLHSFPRAVLALPLLKELNLDHNRISKLPWDLRFLTRLETLSVSHNDLDSLTELTSLPSLKRVSANHNRVCNPPPLQNFPALKLLELSFNLVGEDIFPPLPQPKAATRMAPLELHLKGNRMTGRASCLFQHITSLCLAANGLTSLDVTPLTSLSTLRCHRNALKTLSLHGALLTRLNVSQNELSSISMKYSPRQLVTLDMSQNCVSELPDWLGQCEDLETLDLSRNKISHLPPWIPMPNIVTLSLHHNKISELSFTSRKLLTTACLNSSSKLEEEIPPPTPPRMPTIVPFKSTRELPSRSLLIHKRPAPPPPPESFSEILSPNALPPPPPQFLTQSEKNMLFKDQQLGLRQNGLAPPPVPPLPPHLLRSQSSTSSSPQRKNGSKQSSLYEDDGHYEECELSWEVEKKYQLEVLLLHHNRLKTLPPSLLESLDKLKVLNVSNNQLSYVYEKYPRKSKGRSSSSPNLIADFPPFSFHEQSRSSVNVLASLEKFYGGCNNFSSLEEFEGCKKLKVFHAPYNELQSIPNSLLSSSSELEELVLAGNLLAQLPDSVCALQSLRLLRVNSNPLVELPAVGALPSIKVVDASHCKLTDLKLQQTVSPALVILDLSENRGLQVDPLQMTLCRSSRFVSVVDSSKERSSGLHPRSSQRDTADVFNVGFAECIGQKERLLASQLRQQKNSSNYGRQRGIFGIAEQSAVVSPTSKTTVFSGSTKPTNSSEEISASRILKDIPELLGSHATDENGLKYAILSALRKQHLEGTEHPHSLCIVQLLQISRHNNYSNFIVECCGFGTSRAMMVSLSHNPVMITREDPMSRKEVCVHVDECCEDPSFEAHSRQSSTLPDPKSQAIAVTSDHLAIVIASQGLWSVLDQFEVNQVCLRTADPSLAARRLLTLAQSYGVEEPLSVIVIGFFLAGHEQSHLEKPLGSQKETKVKSNKLSGTAKNGFVGTKDQFSSFKKFKKTSTSRKTELGVEQIERQHLSSDEEEEIKTVTRKPEKSKLKFPVQTVQERIRKSIRRSNNQSKYNKLSLPVVNQPNKYDGMSNNVLDSSNKKLDSDNNISNQTPLDRSSPSGQSYSDDISQILGEEEKTERNPVWPGQLGPVTPSGPFATNLSDNGDEKENLSELDISNVTGHEFKLSSRRERSSYLLDKDFESNQIDISKAIIPTEVDSFLESTKRSKTPNSLPVFRPFYHFPSPNSLILLNKSNISKTEECSESQKPTFVRPTQGIDSARSSFVSRKLKSLSKLKRAASSDEKSFRATVDNEILSDGEISQLSNINKLCNNNDWAESEEVSEEQLRSFEYVLAKNSKMVYLKDLDTTSDAVRDSVKRKNGIKTAKKDMKRQFNHAQSVPDLVLASEENEGKEDGIMNDDKFNAFSRLTKTSTFERGSPLNKSSQYFQRGFTRKSKFGSGTARVLQHRLGSPSAKPQSRNSKNKPEPFKRFGSLQNLGNCQNKIQTVENGEEEHNFTGNLRSSLERRGFGSLASIRPTSFQCHEQQLAEMQERRSHDSGEFESRMNQYWVGATTCF